MRKLFNILAWGTLILAVIVIFGRDLFIDSNQVVNETNQLDKSVGQALIGGDFALIDTHNKPFASKNMKGKPSLVYFGFTSCPDVCPTDMANISKTLDMLGDDANKLNALFITVDPKRDTPEKMSDYLSNFNKSIIGLTGSKEAVDEAANAYKVYHQEENRTSSTDYTMNHSAFIYLMDKNGAYLTHFNHGAAPEVMVAKLQELIGEE